VPQHTVQSRVKRILLASIAGAALVAGPIIFVYGGVYNVAATSEHTTPVYWLLHTAMRQSVKLRARNIDAPELSDAETIAQGRQIYREQCVRCHGAPGVAADPFAFGFMPPAPNLAEAARTWPVAELYWAIKHGIKMTAMPAWEYRLSDAEIWAVVAFVARLPAISPAEYAAMENAASAASR
jgi:mono/diheme cytochrome c family protein